MPHLPRRAAVGTAAARAATLLERSKDLDLVADVLAAVACADLCNVDDVAVVEVVELLGLSAVRFVTEHRLRGGDGRDCVVPAS